MAVGSSIATVAVLETNAESSAVMAPKAITIRTVEVPMPRRLSTNIAKRRATPCLSIAWARMKAPMKVKTVEEPNGSRASSAVTTPSSTIAQMPMNPPIGIGTGSVTHKTMTPSSTAASVCWSSSRPVGTSRKTIVTSGASTSPAVRRVFSKRSSRGDSCCSPRLRYVALSRKALSTSVRRPSPCGRSWAVVTGTSGVEWAASHPITRAPRPETASGGAPAPQAPGVARVTRARRSPPSSAPNVPSYDVAEARGAERVGDLGRGEADQQRALEAPPPSVRRAGARRPRAARRRPSASRAGRGCRRRPGRGGRRPRGRGRPR